MALTTNKSSELRLTEKGVTVPMVVAAATTIYEGAIVSIDASGNVVNASSTLECAGIARSTGTAGQTIQVMYDHLERLPLGTAVITDLFDLIYATDSNTLTRTPNTCIVGEVVGIISSSEVWVHIRKGA